jgi:HlyD family secretion protein
VKRKLTILVVVLAALSATGTAAWWLFWPSKADAGLGQTATASRGSLMVCVREQGEIEAAQRAVISNELRSAAVITSVVPDGTHVHKGDKVIEFECVELEDSITKQTSVVDSALSSLEAAKKNLELKKEEMAEKVRKAKDALTDANQEIKRYEEGEWPIKRDKATGDIQLAERDLKVAQDRLSFKLGVNKEMQDYSPYSENDIEAEKLTVQRLDLALKSAVSAKDMLERYDHARDLRKLESTLRDSELGLKRAELENEIQVGLAKADMDDKDRIHSQAKTELTRLKDEFARRMYVTESDALVVYDTGDRRWSGTVVIAVGERISPRQQLMIIPNMETLRVKTRVYEAVVNQVEKGQKAFIRLDSRPDLVLTGEVEFVAPMPNKQDFWTSNPDVRVFDVFVKLDRLFEGLKPNMTGQVEIVLAELPDVLRVPVAAVFTDQEQTYAWRLSSEKPEKAFIKVGRMNNEMVEVLSGLQDGDRVLLSPPPGAASGKGLRGGSVTRPARETMPAANGGESTSRPSTGPSGADKPRPPRGSLAPGVPGPREPRP